MLKRLSISICLCFGVLFGAIGCTTENQNLYVDKFTLRSIKIEDNDAAMVRGDQQKRLYGAVSLEEHKQRIGQYYILRWNLLNQPKITSWEGKVQLVFRYKQASTGSRIKTISKTYPLGSKQGKWEFKNIGKDYIKGGRILAWQANLIYGGQIISSKQSYLWNN
jgi:hypothetical protein